MRCTVRRVKCEWVERVNKPEASGRIEKVSITHTMIAWFHAWGVEYEEFNTGPGNFSVAIVEDAHGKVHTFQPEQITFLDSK